MVCAWLASAAALFGRAEGRKEVTHQLLPVTGGGRVLGVQLERQDWASFPFVGGGSCLTLLMHQSSEAWVSHSPSTSRPWGRAVNGPPHPRPRLCEEGAKKASWPPAGSAGGAPQTPSDLPTASRLGPADHCLPSGLPLSSIP